MRNITNGQYFNEYAKKHYSQRFKGEFIPFNEALMDGSVIWPLFSQAFIQQRCLDLALDNHFYLQNLQAFLKKLPSIDTVNLFFGKDTFCQINLLGVLAVLEQFNYSCANLYLIDDATCEILEEKIEIDINGYMEIARALFMQQKIILSDLPYLNDAMERYCCFKQGNDEVTAFIRSHRSMSNEQLLQKALVLGQKDGLSDQIILKMIERLER